MSLFVNMSKTIAGLITKSLIPASNIIPTMSAEISQPINSGFSRWRTSYERFIRRKNKTNLFWRSSKTELKRKNSEMGIKCRLRCDKKGLNSTTMLSGANWARLFSISHINNNDNNNIINNIENQNQSNLGTITNNQLFPRPRSVAYQRQIIRTKCGRENCEDPCNYPECPPGNTRWPGRHKHKLFNIYEAYWDEKNDNCCDDPCRWAHDHPRFDDIYLKESDKAKRKYMRTWTECPPRIVQKRVCCFEGQPPEICYRPRKERPQTACPPEPEICSGDDKKCQKLRLPCCCEVRKNLKCKPLTRGLLKCKKFCTPYPSFSECRKPPKNPRRRVECGCLNPLTMCEYWEYWRKRVLSRKGEKC